MYLHKFGQDDIFRNRMITHPEYEFILYSGSAYINNNRNLGVNVATGTISLYEYNVDRNGTTQGLIYPHFVKDGNWLAFPNITTSSYNAYQYGAEVTGTYPLTASLSRKYFPYRDWPFISGSNGAKNSFVQNRGELLALRNTMNYYRPLSNKYYFTGSYMSGTVNKIEIPSIFFDSGIKKGSVSLKFYFTGTLVDEARDSKKNGELISTRGSLSGTTVGVVLYNEGFMLLTSSIAIGAPETTDEYLGSIAQERAKWIYFGAYSQGSISGSTGRHPSASLFSVNFQGTQKIPTMTMFATARQGEVNNSLNPTWLSASSNGLNWRGNIVTGSGQYIEPRQVNIKNTMQNEYCNYESGFEKQVFISQIGIFDKDKNLLGIAKLANPVQKRETDDFTFKLKLDM